MDETNVFIDPLLSCKTPDKKFKLLLNACDEQRAFTGQTESKTRAIIANLNSCLNQSELRPTGIRLLRIFLTQCQDQVFVGHSVFWMTQCLNTAGDSKNEEVAYDVLRLLINMSHKFPELTKPITGTIIPKLLLQLLKTKKSIAALQCLQVTLHHYPGPCKSKLNSIQNFLLTFLDEEEKLLVEHASQCMCYLPLLLTSDNNKGSHWTDVLTKLCATANTLIYELFENIHEAIMPSGLTELSSGYKLNLSSKKGCSARAYNSRATRIINTLTFVEGMLLGDLQHVKAVRADILIALVYRILAVNCKMVGRGHSMQHVSLASVLPDVHVAAFNMLQTLISCCPGGLIKYGPLFCKIVLQTLKWTSKSSVYGMERPYRHLREAAYTFLQNWMLRASAASCVELFAEELVSLMLDDVFMKKDTVTLQFQEKGTKNSSKPLLPGQQWKLADPKANAGPCEAALRALCALVQTSGSLLKPTLHMRMQEISVSILLDIRRAFGPEDHLFPFCDTGCRVQLFRLLLVLTLHPHPKWPPPTQFALSLFAWGQHDSALEVSEFCNLAVACTRQMVHPSQSSHQFPLSVDEMRSSAGLPQLARVQGLQKNLQKRKSPVIESPEVESDTDSTTPNDIKSLNNSLKTSVSNELDEVVFPTPNSGKVKRKKSRASIGEMVTSSVELSPHTDSSKAKKKKRNSSDVEGLSNGKENTPNSGKLDKKKSHLVFTVKELNVGTNKKKSRKSGEDWQVTQMSKDMKIASKKHEPSSTSMKVTEIPIKRKRSVDNIPDTLERSKARKLNKTPKPDVEESPKSWVVQELCQPSKEKLSSEINVTNFSESFMRLSSKSSEKMPSETSKKISPESAEKSPSEPNENLSFESNKKSSKSSENLSSDSSEKLFLKSNEELPSKPSENVSCENSENSFPKSNKKSPSKPSENLCCENSQISFPESNEKSPCNLSENLTCETSVNSFPKSDEESHSKTSESLSSKSTQNLFPESSEKSPSESSDQSSDSEISLLKSNKKSSSKSSEHMSYQSSEKSFPKSIEKSPVKSNEKSPVKSNEKSPVKSNEKSPVKSNGKSPVKSNEKSPVKSNEKSPVISNEKSPVKSNEKSPVKSNEKLPVKSNETSPVKSNEKSPVKSNENKIISLEPNDNSLPGHHMAGMVLTKGKEESLSNLDKIMSLQVSEEKDSEKIIGITSKESNDIVDSVEEKQNNSAKIVSVIELDVDDENIALEQERKYETHISGRGINEKAESGTLKGKKKEQVEIMEADNKSVSEKAPLIAKAKSNLRKDRISSPAKVGSSNSGALKIDSGKDKLGAKSSSAEKSVSKVSPPIVELTISSDSESGEPQKNGSGEFRRITRSFAKRSSTPCKGSEQCIDIEELPSSQENTNIMVLNESTILEEESTATDEPNVVLVDSDESANLTLRIDSDRESIEISDITNEFKEKSKVAEKDKDEIAISKDMALNKPNDLMNRKNSVTSDREMEEVSTGMEAVENSPDVAVEDVASCDKETTGKKLSSNGGEEGSDSGSADEDILKTFVDVVSPKSE